MDAFEVYGPHFENSVALEYYIFTTWKVMLAPQRTGDARAWSFHIVRNLPGVGDTRPRMPPARRLMLWRVMCETSSCRIDFDVLPEAAELLVVAPGVFGRGA